MVCVFSSHPEGRGAAENVEGRVGRIQQLMEALREERVKMEAAAEKADICQHVTHEYDLPDWGSDEDLCAKSQNFIKIFNCLSLLSLSRNTAKCWSRGENSEKTAGD